MQGEYVLYALYSKSGDSFSPKSSAKNKGKVDILEIVQLQSALAVLVGVCF